MLKALGIGFVLLMVLAACTPSAPTVVSITVTGPADNNLKIGEAVQFSVIAKDSGGTELKDKKLTWASSDDNIASVDATGKVTAKRLGKVKITASADKKTGESAEQTTYGLEASGGVSVYRQGQNPSLALLVRFRNKLDTGVVQDTTVLKITGPAGWNSDKAAEISHGGGGRTWVRWRAGAGPAPVSGTYQVSANFDGEDYKTTFAVDTTQTLLAVTNLKVTAVTANSVSCSWDAVTGNVAYWFDTLEETANYKYLDGINTLTPGGTINLRSGTTFESIKTYRCAVHTRNFNPELSTAFIDPFPAQFNTGYDAVPFGLPVASGPKLTLTIPRGQWTAFQDGTGDWKFQGQPDSTFTKELPVTDPAGRYGLAFGSWVAYFILSEAPSFTPSTSRCDDGDFTKDATIQPNVTLTNTTDRGSFTLLRPEGTDRVINYDRNYQGSGVGADLNMLSGTYTLIAAQRAFDNQGVLVKRSPGIFIQRTVTIAPGNTNPLALDFTSGSFTATTNGTATITGVPTGTNPYLNTRFISAAWRYRCNSTSTLAYDSSDAVVNTGSYTANRYTLPSGFFVAGDRLRYSAGTGLTTGNQNDYVDRYIHVAPSAAQPTSFALGAFLTSGEGAATNFLPEASNLPTAFPTSSGFWNMPFSQTIAGNTTTLSINVSKGYLAGLGATATVKFPDLSGLQNFNTNWRFKSGDVSYNLTRLETASNADTLAFFQNSLPTAWTDTGRSNKFTIP